MGSQKVSYNWRSEHRQTWTWLLIQVCSLKLETTKVSFNKGMSKQTMMHSFMAYYSAMKKMEQLIHVTVCIALRAFSSVQFRRSVVSDSLQPHEPQHARPPCPSPTPGVCLNPCPSSWWYHPTISSSFVPVSLCPQSFPASGSFQMSQLFASGGQGIGISASTSVLPMNTQDWSPLGWTGWISLKRNFL